MSSDLSIVDAEQLDTGNIWFKLNKPVTARYVDEAGMINQDMRPDATERSQEWIIQMYSNEKSGVDEEVIVHAAEDKQIVLTDDDRLRIATLLKGHQKPTKAFVAFTCSLVEPHRST